MTIQKTTLFAAVLIGGTVGTTLTTGSMSLAQSEIEATEIEPTAIESTEIEATAPGSTFDDIPSIEPAPEFEPVPDFGIEQPFDSTSFDPPIEGTTSFDPPVEEATTTPAPTEQVVVIPDEKSLNKSERKVAKAINTLEEFVSDPDIDIPTELLSQSEGIIIIPDLFQAGLFFGGKRGVGVMSLRNDDGSWSNPAFIKMTGGSLGLQIGAKSSDLVLIFPRRSMVHEAFAGSYKLGGNVAGTAGAIGTTPIDSSQQYNKDRIYAYSRSSGLYGGVSLEGSELSFNSKRNREFYGQNLSPRQIFGNTQKRIPVIADSLSALLSQAESGEFRLF